MVCCSAHLYYAQEQELMSDYYDIYVQVYMSNTLHIAADWRDIFIRVNLWIVVYYYALLCADYSIRVYQSFGTIFHKIYIAINIFLRIS